MEGNMFKKRLRILQVFPNIFLLGFLLIAFVGIIKTNAFARDLVFGLETAPDRFIPIQIKNPQTFPVSMQIFEGLFDLDEEGKVIPLIVERWETKDYKTWVFHVRQGVFFHRSPIFEKGTREVTAKDVLYCLTRFCSPDSYNAFLLTDSVKGAAEYNQGKAGEVVGFNLMDEYTLQIELLRAERFFINRLSTALISIFPREADRKEYGDQVGLSMAIGTGPYSLESRTETQIILKKNDNYWNRQNMAEVERIIFQVIKNDQTRLVNLRRGSIDMMVLPSSLFGSVFNNEGTLKESYRQKYEVKPVATFNTHFIGFNNKSVKDENLRRAMFWGTNRKEMIDSILYGYADQTGGTVPPGLNGYLPPFPQNLYDPKKANEFLRKSAYKGEPLELLVHDIDNSEQIGQIFQAQMGRFGINIVLKKLDFGSVINQMVKGECQLFSMFFEYVFSSPEPILINLFSSSKIPVPNFFQFSDPEVDKMLESLYTIKDERNSTDYCARIEYRVMEDAPAVFLYRQRYVILYPEVLKGLEVSGNNHYFLEKVRFKR
jgi:ABC-type transport system substrate-binding protein